MFINLLQSCRKGRGEERAVAVCGRRRVGANSSKQIEIALSWDMPEIAFRNQSKTYSR